MSEICSACAFRYENNNIHMIQKCCYESCPQFDIDCKAECNKCLDKVKKKCKKNCSIRPVGDNIIEHYSFKTCLNENNNDPREALRCCLKKNENNFDAQEKCIDAYNALRPVIYEDFKYPEQIDDNLQIKPTNKLCFDKYIFVLICSIVFHILIIGKSIELSQNRLYAIGTILLFYFILYIYIQSNK